MNLVTLDLSAELRETLFKLEQDDEVRVIVLTGSGQRAFCVGSDVKEFHQVWDDVIGKKLQKENETFNCIEFLENPLLPQWKVLSAAAVIRWPWPAICA